MIKNKERNDFGLESIGLNFRASIVMRQKSYGLNSVLEFSLQTLVILVAVNSGFITIK